MTGTIPPRFFRPARLAAARADWRHGGGARPDHDAGAGGPGNRGWAHLARTDAAPPPPPHAASPARHGDHPGPWCGRRHGRTAWAP